VWTTDTIALSRRQPAATRWNAIVVPRKAEIVQIINSVIATVPPKLIPIRWLRRCTIHSLSPLFTRLLSTVDAVVGKIDELFGAPYAAELQGIADTLQIPVADLVLMNLFYEVGQLSRFFLFVFSFPFLFPFLFTPTQFSAQVTCACTSVVCEANNTILHGRNLDYNIPGLQVS
jgi:hypothetical protein